MRRVVRQLFPRLERVNDVAEKGTKTLTSVIFQPDEPLSPTINDVAAKYLALQLAIEDRARLTSVLCHHNPDLVTPTVRTLVSAYDPVIRRIHEAVDLPAGLGDAENFINDLIALGKPPPSKGREESPHADVTVSSFVALCEQHQGSMHRFLHQLAKNGPELTGWYTDWVRQVVQQFRKPDVLGSDADPLTARMSRLFSYLSDAQRKAVIKELDAHAAYLSSLSSSSEERAEALVAATGKSHATAAGACKPGPGVFLAKWQQLLDETEVGPREDGARKVGATRTNDEKGVQSEAKKAPPTHATAKHLLAAFQEMIREHTEAERREEEAPTP